MAGCPSFPKASRCGSLFPTDGPASSGSAGGRPFRSDRHDFGGSPLWPGRPGHFCLVFLPAGHCRISRALRHSRLCGKPHGPVFRIRRCPLRPGPGSAALIRRHCGGPEYALCLPARRTRSRSGGQLPDPAAGPHSLFSEYQCPEAGHAQWNRAARCGRRPENSSAADFPGGHAGALPLPGSGAPAGRCVFIEPDRHAGNGAQGGPPAGCRPCPGRVETGRADGGQGAGPFCLPTTCWMWCFMRTC